MGQRRGLTAEEAALWRRVKASVAPLRPQKRERSEKRDEAETRQGHDTTEASARGEPSPSAEARGRSKPLKRPPRPQADSPGGPIPNAHAQSAVAPKHHRPAKSHQARLGPTPMADRSPEKRVRRGKVEVAASLDLHFYTQDQACRVLHAFLRAEQRAQASVVLVVTGKGGRRVGGEASPGVLRQRFPEWLLDPAVRGLVGGYATAHARHGGGGAFYVFLKRRTD